MYRSLHTNTSKHTLAFSDYPLPETSQDFPHHTAVLRYLREYADHFGLQQYIQFNTVVEALEPADQGRWTIHTRAGEKNSTKTFANSCATQPCGWRTT